MVVFTNEFKNKIKIVVKNKQDTIIINKKKHKFTGVSIFIGGPTSETENIITRKEAQVLYKQLSKYLKH
jgi:hypothetical protein